VTFLQCRVARPFHPLDELMILIRFRIFAKIAPSLRLCRTAVLCTPENSALDTERILPGRILPREYYPGGKIVNYQLIILPPGYYMIRYFSINVYISSKTS